MLRVLFSVRGYVLTIVCEYVAICHTFHDALTLRFDGFNTIAGHLCQLFMFSFDRFTALSCQRRHWIQYCHTLRPCFFSEQSIAI